jgi:hypothetical protein
MVQVSNAKAVLRRLVDEATTPREHADSAVDVLALARSDVPFSERVRVPASIPRVMELVPEDVPLVLHGAELRAAKEALEQSGRPGARTTEDEDRIRGRINVYEA